MNPKEQIEVVIDGTGKKTIELSRLLNNISLFDFYTKPIVSYGSFTEGCDYIFLGNPTIGSVNGSLREKFPHFYNDTVKPHFINRNCYTKKSCISSNGSDLSQEEWFKYQTERVELSSGVAAPRFIKDLIPPGEKVYDWFTVEYSLESIKEKCWIIYNPPSLNSSAVFEFDPIRYKEFKGYWARSESYPENKKPEISYIRYKCDNILKTIEVEELWVNGKKMTEAEAFKIKAEYEVKKLDTLTKTFNSDFMTKIYSKLSMLAKDNFEAELKGPNQNDKITYIATSYSWELFLRSQNIFINHNSSEKDVQAFIEKANKYYLEKWVMKFLSKNGLTQAMTVATVADKQQSPVDNSSSQEINNMAIKTKDKVIQIAISDGQEVAKRVATKQISKLMQDTLVKALTQDMKGKKKSETKTALEEFFASEKGMAVIQVLCGVGLPFAQKYIPEQYHGKLTMIADEMRVQGETTAALELIGAVEPLIKMAAGGIMNSLNQFSSVEEFVRIETGSVEVSKTDNQKEAEVVELASAKERAKA